LRGADLTGTQLEGPGQKHSWRSVPLLGARYNSRTRRPAGFDPAKHGAILER
jgi:hypothetical protein